MPIPNSATAVVERRKIVDYLLNSAHPDNGGNAAFFASLGFSINQPQIFADALRMVALQTAALNMIESAHGRKCVADGRIDMPSGRCPMIRTIWIIDHGGNVPRLVTAYPYGERSKP
jgi:hypothetical protein